MGPISTLYPCQVQMTVLRLANGSSRLQRPGTLAKFRHGPTISTTSIEMRHEASSGGQKGVQFDNRGMSGSRFGYARLATHSCPALVCVGACAARYTLPWLLIATSYRGRIPR